MAQPTPTPSVLPPLTSEQEPAVRKFWQFENLQPYIPEVMVGSSTFRELFEAYRGLGDERKQKCLLSFSVFPQDKTIKKRAFIHWWVGEEFLESQNDEDLDQESNDLFEEFIKEGILELVSEKRRERSKLYRINPLIRYALIAIAKRKRFVDFDPLGYPGIDFNSNGNRRQDSSAKHENLRVVTTTEGLSLWELTYEFRLKEEKVASLLNVSEADVDLRKESFSKMNYLKVLQLGRLQTDTQPVNVDDTAFLQGLKKMRQLRYFSLGGIARVTKLPESISKLSNLIILDLNNCGYLEALPKGIGALTRLKWLDISACYLINHMPPGLAKLTNLQVLKGFLIRKKCDYQKVCSLDDLATLKYLKKLSITVIGTDPNTDELSKLSNFAKLEILSVEWVENGGKSEGSSEENSKGKIMPTGAPRRSGEPKTEFTKPPASPSLKKLKLSCLPSSQMPSWVKQLNLASLEKFYVMKGKLSQLTVLSNKWKLKILRLRSLSKLQMDWPYLEEKFPDLRYVEIVECPKVTLFPGDENGEWVRDDCDPKDE